MRKVPFIYRHQNVRKLLNQSKVGVLDVAAVKTDHEVELTWLIDIFELGIVELQHLGIDLEANFLAFTWLQSHMLETLEFLNRTSDRTSEIVSVELHDGSGFALASVGESHLCLDAAIGCEAVGA